MSLSSLKPALAGLRAQQRNMEVVGNNIANASTPAFKASRAEFVTMLTGVVSFGAAPTESFGGTNPIEQGQGVQVGAVSRDFTQGSLEITGIESDLAISGAGFFVAKDSVGKQIYTRDGSFALNSVNQIYDPVTGNVLQGWLADEGFEISTGGPLEPLVVPLGNLTIAQATSFVSLEGTLGAGGVEQNEGTRVFSEVLYDLSRPSSALISADNPVGFERAGEDSLLQNVVVRNGDFVPFSNVAGDRSVGSAANFRRLFPEDANGTRVSINASKGDRLLGASSFVVGTDGSTLGEFSLAVQRSLGIADGSRISEATGAPTYSYLREHLVSGAEISGTITDVDTVTSTSVSLANGDVRGARVGDYVRFTEGEAAGRISKITAVTDADSDGVDDGFSFEPIDVVPGVGDVFKINAPAGVGVTANSQLVAVSLANGAPAVTTNPPVASFTIVDPDVSDFAVDFGVSANDIVEYDVGGTTFTATVQTVTGNQIVVAYDSTQNPAQPEPSSGDFVISRAPRGSIAVAGNAGSVNDISGLQFSINGTVEQIFDQAELESATGQSVTTNITVFDSLGNPHELQVSLYRESVRNGETQYRYIAESPSDTDGDRVVGTGTVAFNTAGQFQSEGATTNRVSIDLEGRQDESAAVVSPLSVELDFSQLTQFQGESSIRLLETDGFAPGTLDRYSVGQDGTITGNFDNGQSRPIGKVALVRFANANGLIEDGNNFFSVSPSSGAPQVGEPATLGFGTLRGGALEDANVDLAEQFAELLVGQRAFQANARTISASDTLLQELVNII